MKPLEQIDELVTFEARNISKSYGVVKALSDVSLKLLQGEVHAVVGENGAGKSTLMNIISGKVHPDKGTLLRNGRPVVFRSTSDAQAANIAIAPQEINLVPRLTVVENILLGAQERDRFGQINWQKTNERAAASLRRIDETIDPFVPAQSLSKAQQQLVQIARAVTTSAQILIFDEPTAALTDREAEKLFSFMRDFRSAGNSIFYVSHRLDEIMELSQSITVLRDGRLVADLNAQETTKAEIVRHMAGREVEPVAKVDRKPEIGKPVLKVSNLTRTGEFSDISFDLNEREILGIAGLIGSGRSELGKCLFGVTSAASGEIEIFGEKSKIRHPADAISLGLVYLPEERKQDGIFPLLSITENTCISSLGKFRGLMALRFSDMVRETEAYVKQLKIKIGLESDPITSLSGGNQQKVILARWLMRDSRILILDEPTRGVDVNAKSEIQSVLRKLANDGISMIYISSELQEVIDVSDRIMVMHEGELKGTMEASEATQESLLALAMS